MDEEPVENKIFGDKADEHFVYILSGGVGSSGEQLARTVLAQFPGTNVSIRIYPKVFTKKQVRQILGSLVESNGIIAYTFVDPDLRRAVQKFALSSGLVAIDLIGSLMENLSARLDQKPLGKPGLYRQLYRSYFDRIDAMDYALHHDDGKNPDGWKDAEIILLGASRVGKTPISLYLSVMGWKVANIPIVSAIPIREDLFRLDKRRLVGLTIDPSELVGHREHRQRLLGVSAGKPDYTNPVKVYEELESIDKILRRAGIASIDVTGKPIETCADEVIRLVRRNLKRPATG